MINNRQAGRRRGRNNARPNNNGRGGGDSGNRIDNRARGNAAQLLEKYRNMARDAQMTGDRVNMEYYLQFADHYFRVLADNRTRQEEQQNRQQLRRHEGEDYFADEIDSDMVADDDPFSPRMSEHITREPMPRSDNSARDAAPRGGDSGPRNDNNARGDNSARDHSSRNDSYQDGRSDRNDRPERSEWKERTARAERQPRERNECQLRENRENNIVEAQVCEHPRKRSSAEPDRRLRHDTARVKEEPAEAPQGGLDIAVLPPSIIQADNIVQDDNDAGPFEEASEEVVSRRRTRASRAEAAE